MIRNLSCLVLCLALMLPGGCSREDTPTFPTTPPDNVAEPELIARAIIQASGWEYDKDLELPVALELQDGRNGPPFLREYQRETLLGDIAHYWWEIPIGNGEHEVIRLHRVVRESRPHKPIRTKKTLFGLHGTPGHFEAMFLVGSIVPAVPADHSLAVFLAQDNVDVWGIDQAYTLLPAAIEDFSFMQGWGLQFDAENLLTGMSIARFVRSFTGSGNTKLNLLGYSTGFMTGFAALNIETQLPPGRRQIGGFIPVDYFYKTQEAIWIDGECEWAAIVADMIQNGEYQHSYGMLFQMLGLLADQDPAGDSPIIPGTTNLQAALFAGAMTSDIFGGVDHYHFFGGIFDVDGNVVDLNYTPVPWYLGWLQQFNNYGSNFLEYDIAAVHCDEIETPFDDHLREIRVPVFFVGARGGFGRLMDYTATLIGSDDVTLLNVQIDPDMILDFGHVDLFAAAIAPQVAWQPILTWINAHSHPGNP